MKQKVVTPTTSDRAGAEDGRGGLHASTTTSSSPPTASNPAVREYAASLYESTAEPSRGPRLLGSQHFCTCPPRRVAFLEAYQSLVLNQPDQRRSGCMKESFLTFARPRRGPRRIARITPPALVLLVALFWGGDTMSWFPRSEHT